MHLCARTWQRDRGYATWHVCSFGAHRSVLRHPYVCIDLQENYQG